MGYSNSSIRGYAHDLDLVDGIWIESSNEETRRSLPNRY